MRKWVLGWDVLCHGGVAFRHKLTTSGQRLGRRYLAQKGWGHPLLFDVYEYAQELRFKPLHETDASVRWKVLRSYARTKREVWKDGILLTAPEIGGAVGIFRQGFWHAFGVDLKTARVEKNAP